MAKRKAPAKEPKQTSRKNERPQPPLDEPPKRSLRLTFRYEGQYIELVSAKKITMISPPSDSLRRQEPRSGFCLELRTQRGKVLYRRFGANPLQTSVEVLGDDDDRPFRRVDVDAPAGEFQVLVPVLDNAVKLELLTDAFNKKPGPAHCVASIDILNLPRKKAR